MENTKLQDNWKQRIVAALAAYGGLTDRLYQ